MNIGNTKEISDQIPKEHIPLMKLIDKKINNDMNKVLHKMDSIKIEMGAMQKLLWSIIYGLGGIILTGIIALLIAIFNK